MFRWVACPQYFYQIDVIVRACAWRCEQGRRRAAFAIDIAEAESAAPCGFWTD